MAPPFGEKRKFFIKNVAGGLTSRSECDIMIISIEKLISEDIKMKHIQTLDTKNLCESAKNGGCGECQTSCQSACKTSCGIANQQCENSAE